MSYELYNTDIELNQSCRDYLTDIFNEADKRGVMCLVTGDTVMKSDMMFFKNLRLEYINIPVWNKITLRSFQLLENILDEPNKNSTTMQISFEEHFSKEELNDIRTKINDVYTNSYMYKMIKN